MWVSCSWGSIIDKTFSALEARMDTGGGALPQGRVSIPRQGQSTGAGSPGRSFCRCFLRVVCMVSLCRQLSAKRVRSLSHCGQMDIVVCVGHSTGHAAALCLNQQWFEVWVAVPISQRLTLRAKGGVTYCPGHLATSSPGSSGSRSPGLGHPVAEQQLSAQARLPHRRPHIGCSSGACVLGPPQPQNGIPSVWVVREHVRALNIQNGGKGPPGWLSQQNIRLLILGS